MTFAPPLLRCCLLSGGASRRMGRDKALLSHPEGGTWLERQLRLLAALGAPLTLLSGWPTHLEQAAALARELVVDVELLRERQPPQGPLVALGGLMEAHPGERLLLCPVDLPALDLSALRALLESAIDAPGAIWIAAAERAQPLLGLYPSDLPHRQSLQEALARGERGLQRWLAGEVVHVLDMPAGVLVNVNTPVDLDRWRAAIKPQPDCSTSR